MAIILTFVLGIFNNAFAQDSIVEPVVINRQQVESVCFGTQCLF